MDIGPQAAEATKTEEAVCVVCDTKTGCTCQPCVNTALGTVIMLIYRTFLLTYLYRHVLCISSRTQTMNKQVLYTGTKLKETNGP